MKRDRIFYSACCISAIGIVLAILGYDLALLLFVAAYLLRPALHEFGLAQQYADERQLVIHSRSGNLAFVIVILATAGLALWKISQGERPEELYTLIIIGLAARALTGLVMAGDYRKAGMVIIGAIGFFLGLFVVLEGGFSLASVGGVVVALTIIGIGRLARKYPRVIGVILIILILGAIVFFKLYQGRKASMDLWLFLVTPLAISSACLFLGSGKEDKAVSPKLRTIVFGSLGAGAALIFTLLVIFGSGEKQISGAAALVPEGEINNIQGVPCTGYIDFYKNGKLESCTLARDDTISGQPLPAGTVVHFKPDSVFDWCFLQQTTEIQGHLCRGQSHGFMTGFHPNGQLKTAWLAEDEVIQEIPCAKFRFLSVIFGGGDGTYFHENGKLKFCTLSEDFTIDGRELERGDHLRFDEEGKLIAEK